MLAPPPPPPQHRHTLYIPAPARLFLFIRLLVGSRRRIRIVRQVHGRVWSCFAISTFAIISALEKDFCRILLAFYVRASCECIRGVEKFFCADSRAHTAEEKAIESRLLNWCWWMWCSGQPETSLDRLHLPSPWRVGKPSWRCVVVLIESVVIVNQ